MKKSVFVLGLLCAASIVSAQTYKNGVWYALYDDSEHGMSTISSYELGNNIFAPTNGQLSFKWKYTKVELTGWFASNATHIYESADGGSSSTEIGTLTDKTWDTEHTTNIQVSTNINWLQWDRPVGNTHKVTIYALRIPLAKHILLPSGTYGTKTGSLSFEDTDMDTVSAAQHVNLRSFLTNGDITITSSLPQIFRIGSADNTEGLTYAVGANACASSNGTATQAGGGTLGNIAKYGFDVYFAPQDSLNYEATITITDGTSTATVTVRGKGLYVEPPTPPTPPEPEDSYYAYSASICEGDSYTDSLFTDLTEAGIYMDTIPNVAGADSIITFTLAVNPVYAFSDSLTMRVGDAETWQAIDLSVLPACDTVLTAAYATIHGCDSIYTLALTVLARPTTYGNDTIELCSGESAEYEGKTYKRAMIDSVLLSQKNQFGGDSIVELVVFVYPTLSITVTETIIEGTEQTWEGYDLSTYPVGDTTLVAAYSSIHGCDSIYTLKLTVTEKPVIPDPEPHEGINNASVETKARKIIRNGQIYIRKGDELFDVLGNKVQGAL